MRPENNPKPYLTKYPAETTKTQKNNRDWGGRGTCNTCANFKDLPLENGENIGLLRDF